jgi:hypothetical protein
MKQDGFGHYLIDSHTKTRTNVGFNDYSHNSPFSNKLFNFSGTGMSSSFRGPLVHPSAMTQYPQLTGKSCDSTKNQSHRTHLNPEADRKAQDAGAFGGQEQATTVNPFNTQFSKRKEVAFNGSAIASKSKPVTMSNSSEEDYEIKPQDIYGPQNNYGKTMISRFTSERQEENFEYE